MKKIMLFAVLLQAAPSFAQKADCKYKKDEVDKFTKKKILWTKEESLTSFTGGILDAQGKMEDDKKYLVLQTVRNEDRPDKPTKDDLNNAVVVPAGTKVILLMADQKNLELTTEKEYKAPSSYVIKYRAKGTPGEVMYYQVNSTVYLHYLIDANAIKTLTSKGVTNVRLYLNSEVHLDFEVSKKKYGVLQEVVKCIM